MLTVLFTLRDCFRARSILQAEILALRHQLLVLQRSTVSAGCVSVGPTVSCGSGFRDCGTIGARHCSWSSRRLSSPGIARGFDCIGIGRVVAILKDDRVYLQKLIVEKGIPHWNQERKCHGFDEEVSLQTFLRKNRKVTPFAQPEDRQFRMIVQPLQGAT